MTPQEKNVFGKLFTKTELGTHKVELALLQDLNKEADKIILKTKELKSEGQRLDKELFNFRDIYNVDAVKFINLKADYVKMAKELGIDVDTKFDKIFNDLSDAKSTYRYLIS